jgi:hypothetical protein
MLGTLIIGIYPFIILVLGILLPPHLVSMITGLLSQEEGVLFFVIFFIVDVHPGVVILAVMFAEDVLGYPIDDDEFKGLMLWFYGLVLGGVGLLLGFLFPDSIIIWY